MALLDGFEFLVLRLADGGIEQSFEAVGDAADSRMHDQYPRTGGTPCGDNARDVFPVGERRDAAATELQDDPGRGRAAHGRKDLLRA